jgi:CRISPR-associated protein Cmr6
MPLSGSFFRILSSQPFHDFSAPLSTPLTEDEWNTIWRIWEQGLSMGIGCRVSTGYGQLEEHQGDLLFRCRLQGQGISPLRLDGFPEFRPNIFRAALRGHALRIFGGLTTEKNAEALVDTLFGGIQRGQDKWGLLAMTFRDRSLTPDEGKDTYKVTGDLTWFLTQPISDSKTTALKDLVRRLMQFAMVFGGFGKSWRRADHRLFMEDYDKHLIGCHWQWAGQRSPVTHNPVRKLDHIPAFIEAVQISARRWMEVQGVPSSKTTANWREIWHPDNVQVWGRVSGDREQGIMGRDDCQAIHWLHGVYKYDYRGGREVPLSIKGSSVTGQLNRIGRLWHRMYPIVLKKPDPANEGKFTPISTLNYLELLTLFPDETPEFNQFLEFMHSQQSKFSSLWGTSNSSRES